MAGSSPFTVMTNIFVTEFSKFSETVRKNSIRLILFSFLTNVRIVSSCLVNFFSFYGSRRMISSGK